MTQERFIVGVGEAALRGVRGDLVITSPTSAHVQRLRTRLSRDTTSLATVCLPNGVPARSDYGACDALFYADVVYVLARDVRRLLDDSQRVCDFMGCLVSNAGMRGRSPIEQMDPTEAYLSLWCTLLRTALLAETPVLLRLQPGLWDPANSQGWCRVVNGTQALRCD